MLKSKRIRSGNSGKHLGIFLEGFHDCSENLNERLFECFSGWNVFNSCIKNEGAFCFIKYVTLNRFCDREELVLVICNRFYVRWSGGCIFVIKYRTVEKKYEVNLTSKPTLQIGFKQFWKLCLHLCSHNWLRPMYSLMVSLIP